MSTTRDNPAPTSLAFRPVSSTSANLPQTVIRPPTRVPKPALGELWRYRAICLVLVRRSIMVRYRQTVVGAMWAILQPLLLMIVFTVFFGVLANVRSEGMPYAVFVMTGLTIWQVVAKVLNEGSLSVVSNAGIVNKIYFPRAYFPIASALGSLVDLAFAMLALAVMLAIYGILPGWQIVFAPVFIGIAVAAVTGVALWLSALYVTYRDVAQLLPAATQLWLFVSPIIYSGTIVPEQFRPIYWLNPMAIAVDGLRWSILGTAMPPAAEFILGISVAALLLVGGYLFFRQREPSFSDTV